MRLIRLCLTVMLLCLLTPWAAAARLSVTPPCHAHQAMAEQATQHAADALTHPAAPAGQPTLHRSAPSPWGVADLSTSRDDGPHLPCGDCAACHGVALAPAVPQLSGPTDVHDAPRWAPSLSDGRWLGCELYRPPRG